MFDGAALMLAADVLERYRAALKTIAESGEHARHCNGWNGPDGSEWMVDAECDCPIRVARLALEERP
jgi:hypothetical protein